jgi:tetracycline resistance efflux pump
MTTFESLLPPMLVLAVGLITHKIILALLAGILLSSLLVNGYDLFANFTLIKQVISQNIFASQANLNIFVFLLLLGVIVTLIQHTNGALAYQRLAAAKVVSKRDAEVSSLLLSTTLFIDDYLSCLTVGSVIKPLTDLHKVSRLKLAYLVDTMAAPMAILCPLSSWVAAITGFFRENGITDQVSNTTVLVANPFLAYLSVLPFMFYSFLLIISTWFIVLKRISFGPMLKAEQLALNQQHDDHKDAINKDATILDFFGPIILLLLTIPIVILYTGNWQLFGGNNTFFAAFIHANISQALCVGGGVSMLVSTLWFVSKKKLTLAHTLKVYKSGISLMFPAIIILVLAWALGDLLRTELHTGEHLAQLLQGLVNVNLLPMLLFLIALCISFAIGSSWGTAAILFPIAIDLVISLTNTAPLTPLAHVPVMLPVLGAILSGAVAGNHISPISDTTVMSSTSTQTNLIEHVNTQLPYAVPVILATALCFLASGFIVQYSLWYATLLPVSIAIMLLIIVFKKLNCVPK